MLLKIFLLAFGFAHISAGYKLFVYNPKTGGSHVNFVGKVADMLVQAGHDVVCFLF